jgi:hypothetical protein
MYGFASLFFYFPAEYADTTTYRKLLARLRMTAWRNGPSSAPSNVKPPATATQLDPWPVLYHQLWRTLLNGSTFPSHHALPHSSITPKRPALPPELIALIFRKASILIPDQDLSAISTKRVHVLAIYGHKEARVWFCSRALTASEVARTAAVQLTTYSRDQGWCSQPENGSYSWFELGVLPGTGSGVVETIGLEDGAVRWVRSHHNRLAERELAHLQGPIISIDDLELEVGGIIAVRACCQFGTWVNLAENGKLRFWKWFEPVIPLV